MRSPLVVVVGCAAGEPEPSPEPAPLPTVEANQSTPQQTKAIYPGTRAGCLQSCWDKLIGCMTLLCRSTKGVDGTIYSWSVERRANPPYAIAFVTLAEGPTMLSTIVDCDLDAIRIGQAVRVVGGVRARGRAMSASPH